MSRILQLAVRVWTFLWTLLVLALVGNMLATANHAEAATNYVMFVSAFAMFTLFYLFPASWNIEWSGHPIIMIVIDLLNSLFTFTAAVSYASLIGAYNCGNPAYSQHNMITGNTRDTEKRCHEAQASTAFLWFMWAGFTLSLILDFFLSGGSGVNLRSSRTSTRRRPNMAQV